MCKHYAKFEYKGIKTVGVTDYTLKTMCKHSKCGENVIMSSFNTPKNIINIIKCAQKGDAPLQCANNLIQSLKIKE